ncbi:hypothetical protein [Cupriavidus sp. D39]|uniref:hypothetical protein n=1 Tax=Cupriavidus sp. D39 TaxID=2997877 RepID=UPI00226FEB4B|nr:hypothetical protein [Cupriavidus sp. D39]MCY0853296.1 hypothetical protein [Cupriavidus sp. D39]
MLPLETRLITLALLFCTIGPAVNDGAIAATPSEGMARASGCKALVDIARDSLLSDLEAVCLPTAVSFCAEKNRIARSIVDYIDTQRQQGGDECDTALEVLDRLRTLPSQH